MVGTRPPRSAPTAVGAGLLVAGTAQYLLAQVVTASAWRPSYSWWDNSISDLGSTACGQLKLHRRSTYTCSSLHAVMNSGFVLSGVLIVVGTFLVWSWWPARALRTTALGLWIAVGVLKIVVGLVPENTDGALHLLGALNLPLSSAAMLVSGVVAHGRYPAVTRLSVVLGLVALLGGVLFLSEAYLGASPPVIGFGAVERLVDLPTAAWFIAVGALVMRSSRRRGALFTRTAA